MITRHSERNVCNRTRLSKARCKQKVNYKPTKTEFGRKRRKDNVHNYLPKAEFEQTAKRFYRSKHQGTKTIIELADQFHK